MRVWSERRSSVESGCWECERILLLLSLSLPRCAVLCVEDSLSPLLLRVPVRLESAAFELELELEPHSNSPPAESCAAARSVCSTDAAGRERCIPCLTNTACQPLRAHAGIATKPRMSIAPGIPLQLVGATESTPAAPSPPVPPDSVDSAAANRHLDAVPASHIAASPSALSTHLQATSTLLAELHTSQPVCTTTDVEDLVLLDGSARRRPPVVPAYCPYRVQLQIGRTYRWCACGRSSSQPWCDDSHSDADPQPLLFSVSAAQRLHYLCGCKYTSKPPFCDGSHIHAVSGAEEQRTQQATGAT